MSSDNGKLEESVKTDIRTLNKRISQQFQLVSRTQYRIVVANQTFDQQYNFFLEIIPQVGRHRSKPLHSIKEYDLGYLEQVINGLSTKLTIVYRGFDNLRWTSNNYLIR